MFCRFLMYSSRSRLGPKSGDDASFPLGLKSKMILLRRRPLLPALASSHRLRTRLYTSLLMGLLTVTKTPSSGGGSFGSSVRAAADQVINASIEAAQDRKSVVYEKR